MPAPAVASDTLAVPLPKPAAPPWPSKESEYELGGSRSASSSLPLNLALTGPIAAVVSTRYSVSVTFAIDSQPVMQALSTAGSFKPRQTSACAAEMICSPVISMDYPSPR